MDYIDDSKLLAIYQCSWETQNEGLLSLIFDEEVIYQEKPNNVISGLDELKSYWIENKAKQKEVKFSSSNVSKHGEIVSFDWVATYVSNTGARRRLQGVMEWHVRKGRIFKLVEDFENTYIL